MAISNRKKKKELTEEPLSLYKLYVYGLWTVDNELPVHVKERGATFSIQLGFSGIYVEESARVRNINEFCELLSKIHRNDDKKLYKGVSKIFRSARETLPGIDFAVYSHNEGEKSKLLLIQITQDTNDPFWNSLILNSKRKISM